MAEPSKAVFLSYASQDAEAVRHIADALRAADIEVWFDQSALRGGDAWDHKIRTQIRDCALFFPIVSRHTQARPEGYFRLEWRLADQRTHLMGRSRPFLVPVCVDDTPETEADVPDSFSAAQWTRLPAGITSPAFVECVMHLLSPDTHVAPTPAGRLAGASPVTAPSPAAAANKPEWASVPTVQFLPAVHGAIPEKSIAVLPFVDMSAKKDQEYFSDGLAEALINLLTQVRDLRVPARTSSFYFKGKTEELGVIAEKLRVAHILEGSVRKAGKTIRVTAHLIRADNGYHLWSKTYDREFKKIFKLQDEIADAVVSALKAQLLPAPEVINRHRPANTEAYTQYLLGKQFYGLRTVDGMHRAIAALQQAVVLDPNYASAYAQIAVATFGLVEIGAESAEANAERAIAAAEKAVALAPGLAEAYAQRAYIRWRSQWDWHGAQVDLETALQLDPHDSASQRGFGVFLGALGRFPEAIAATQVAIEIDPLDANTWFVLGLCFHGAGQSAAGQQALSRALEISPGSAVATARLGAMQLLDGRVQEALQTNSQQQNEAWRWSGLAMVEHTLHNAEQSKQALDEVITKYGRISPCVVAMVYAWRRNADMAFEWLERAYLQRDPIVSLIKLDPILPRLRGDPRYKALLRKMNLPE